MTRQPLGIHGYIHGPTDQDPILDENWITVGTPGVDGVDALIAENLSPYDVTPWVPFQNSWTQTGTDDPFQFVLGVGGWVRTRGKPTGGADGSVVTTLPTPYWPTRREHFVSHGADSGTVALWYVDTNGDVVFEAAYSLT